VGSIVGSAVGFTVGTDVGTTVGTNVGWSDGTAVGSIVGSAVGLTVGTDVGTTVGSVVGSRVGTAVGSLVGTDVGSLVGTNVGSRVGTNVGSRVGSLVVGTAVGSLVGTNVGSRVGSVVGLTVLHTRLLLYSNGASLSLRTFEFSKVKLYCPAGRVTCMMYSVGSWSGGSCTLSSSEIAIEPSRENTAIPISAKGNGRSEAVTSQMMVASSMRSRDMMRRPQLASWVPATISPQSMSEVLNPG